MLSVGTRVGPYEVNAPLGAGGMGEVYRARDSRLGRDVAIKVLRSGCGSEQDRQRLEFEARASSRLNHPNILTIYDVGESDGSPYVVSELLEGESLRNLIPPDGMPVRKLLDVAVQIADGLAAAHAAQLVHRDLKPDNVMVLRDGRVKILDFGLAKPVASADEDAVTVTQPRGERDGVQTAAGMMVGTLHYMSPEQVQGAPLDFRSDQFSFGCLLYEMVTGQRPFKRPDRIGVLSAIVREEPAPLQSFVPALPAPLRWIVDRCLAKDPADRYASTADLHYHLRDLRDHLSEVSSRQEIPIPQRRSRIRSKTLIISTAFISLLTGFLAAVRMHQHDRGVSTYKFTPFATEAMDEADPVWSPDGQTLAYSGSVKGIAQIFARRLDSSLPSQLTASDWECRHPFWSSDGSTLYYWSHGAVWSVGAAGGAPVQVVADVSFGRAPAALSPDGSTLVFFRPDEAMHRLCIMNMRTKTVSLFQRDSLPRRFRLPGAVFFSPKGDQLAVSMVRSIDVAGGSELWRVPWPDGTPALLGGSFWPEFIPVMPRWMPDNRHLILGSAVAPGENSHLYMMDALDGKLETITAGTSDERDPSPSPDGRRIAFVNGGLDVNLVDLSLATGSPKPLLATSRQETSPDWSHSGRLLVYVSDASGPPEIWMRRIDETSAHPIVRANDEGHLSFAVPRFSPTDDRLAYVRTGAKHRIWISNLSGGQAVPLESESADQHSPAWSPDGNWIAYTRFFHNEWQIAKAPAGGSGQPVRLSVGGGAAASLDWSTSGKWIGYVYTGNLTVLPAEGGPERVIQSDTAAFAFALGGDQVYAARRSQKEGWQLTVLDVPSGQVRQSIPLGLPAEAIVSSFRIHPDGTRATIAQGAWRRDIWILEGFAPRRGLLDFLRSPGTSMPAQRSLTGDY